MVNAVDIRPPRSSARIDPIARIVFGGIPNSPAASKRPFLSVSPSDPGEQQRNTMGVTLAVSEQTAALQQQPVELRLAS